MPADRLSGPWRRCDLVQSDAPSFQHFCGDVAELFECTSLNSRSRRYESQGLGIRERGLKDRHFLYFIDWSEGRNGIYVASLDNGEGTLLSSDIRGNVAFAAGHVLFVRDGTLFAQRFDTEKLRLAGDPIPVVSQEMEQDAGFGQAGFSVADSGVLVYQSRPRYSSRLACFDRSGKEMQPVGEAASYEPTLSPRAGSQ